jgi:hypothetical protein
MRAVAAFAFEVAPYDSDNPVIAFGGPVACGRIRAVALASHSESRSSFAAQRKYRPSGDRTLYTVTRPPQNRHQDACVWATTLVGRGSA